MQSGPVGWVRKLLGRGELDCEEIRDLSSEYVDGTLRESISTRFRRHLDTCENCNSFVATFRATVLTLRDLPRRQPPDDLTKRVQEQINAVASQEGPDKETTP